VSLGNILTMLLWRMNNNLFFGGDLACRAVVYFQVVSVYYSTYVLITMTIDRYEAICNPLIGLGSLFIEFTFVSKVLAVFFKTLYLIEKKPEKTKKLPFLDQILPNRLF
jgi:hypothetical protein